jgi:uncharacterized lipoprotein NlpE involved in copper resistance
VDGELPVKAIWIVLTVVVLLVGCGNKEEVSRGQKLESLSKEVTIKVPDVITDWGPKKKGANQSAQDVTDSKK